MTKTSHTVSAIDVKSVIVRKQVNGTIKTLKEVESLVSGLTLNIEVKKSSKTNNTTILYRRSTVLL